MMQSHIGFLVDISGEDGKMTKQLSDRQLKAQLKDLARLKKKDKCYFNETRICNHTCKAHSHNRVAWGVKFLQWTRWFKFAKGKCLLQELLKEGKISLKEVKDQIEGT